LIGKMRGSIDVL